jgi:Rha family phage regulatory protein
VVQTGLKQHEVCMSQIVTQNAVTMSSRQIAQITGKNHADVLRDIRRMFAGLEITESRFAGSYTDSTGRTLPMFDLDEEMTLCLTSGYDVKQRMAIIRQWKQMRDAPQFKIPQTMPDALRLAADLAEQNTHLQLVVAEQAPKVVALQRIADARGSLCLTDAAKHLGVQRKALLAWMQANRWIYRREGCARWLAYQPREAAGLLEHRVTVIGTDDDGDQRLASQVRVTPKGLVALSLKAAGGAL